MQACEEYFDIKSKNFDNRVTASYLLLKDINDTDEHLAELIKILNPEKFRIQILLYNELTSKIIWNNLYMIVMQMIK